MNLLKLLTTAGVPEALRAQAIACFFGLWQGGGLATARTHTSQNSSARTTPRNIDRGADFRAAEIVALFIASGYRLRQNPTYTRNSPAAYDSLPLSYRPECCFHGTTFTSCICTSLQTPNPKYLIGAAPTDFSSIWTKDLTLWKSL